MDLTTLSTEELNAIGDDDVRVEKYRRENLAKIPVSKAALDTVIAASAKISLSGIKTEQDAIDGDYVVLDLSGMDASVRDDAMAELAADGGIVAGASKIRVHANRATKPEGHFEKLEALL